MFDLKVINSVLEQLEEERGVAKEKVLEAIELALASAYKKEYGKRNQIIKAKFNIDSGDVEFFQVKVVKDPSQLIMDEEEVDEELEDPENIRVRFDAEKHILIDDAKLLRKDAQIDEELIFPLEKKDDFGRISAQTAKQVIMQKIREAEKTSVLKEFGEHEQEIVSGTIQRIERGSIYLDMGRAVGQIPYSEQIPGEHFKQGERVRAYLVAVEETPRGVFLKLSRSHSKFLEELFKAEVPELTSGVVEVKSIAREAGSRSKIAVYSTDDHIDPVGSLVGQRGVRVSTIMSELGGEKIDIIEWSEDVSKFIEESLSPAQVVSVEINEDTELATVIVTEDQQSLAIGKGGQNVRLAAKLTGWKIDIKSVSIGGENKEDELEEEVAPEEIAEEVTEEITEEAVAEKSDEVPAEKDSEEKEVSEETPAEEVAEAEETPAEAEEKNEK